MPNVAKILLAGLRRRGFALALSPAPLPGPRPPDWERVVVAPVSALTEADREAIDTHRQALLELLWREEPDSTTVIGWPQDSPAWNGDGFGWTPMTRRDDGFTPEEETSS